VNGFGVGVGVGVGVASPSICRLSCCQVVLESHFPPFEPPPSRFCIHLR